MIDVTLDDTYRPAPIPQPPPAPVTVPVANQAERREMFRVALEIAIIVLMLVVMATLIWVATHRNAAPAPGPAPTPDVVSEAAKTTAIRFIPRLASAYGEGWIAAADALEKGKSAAEAQKVLQEKWKDERVKELLSVVKPTFEGFLPEGQEPADPARRAQVVQLWREFGRWLQKGGR